MSAAPRRSRRWLLVGFLSQDARAALARVLDCPFTDEAFERPGVMVAPDVTFVASPQDDGSLRVIAHFNRSWPMFETSDAWLDERVDRAAASVQLRVAGPGREVLPGT